MPRRPGTPYHVSQAETHQRPQQSAQHQHSSTQARPLRRCVAQTYSFEEERLSPVLQQEMDRL